MFVSWNQTLLTGLQQGDAAVYQSMLAMLGMGALAMKLKNSLSGRRDPENAASLLVESLDYSGLLTLPMEVDNISDKLYVISDIANVSDFAVNNEDYLIPSSALNSTISGLVSRSILNKTYIKNGDFHGCRYYKEYIEGRY